MSENGLMEALRLPEVEILAGDPNGDMRPSRPFDEDAIVFLDKLSAKLIRDPAGRAWSDVIAFAYWCRRSNVEAVRERSFGASDEVRLGRGLAFHIAPSNVPVNFAFSFVFALLAGNANITRVPSKLFPQVEAICHVAAEVMKEFPTIAANNAFVRYPSSSEATKLFSAAADARIIWGGDATVERIKMFPAKPRCIDVAFSDRYSVAFIDGRAVLDAEGNTLAELAKAFYNDTYLMDQNACSSPMIIFWVDGSPEARTAFWTAVHDYALRNYDLQPAVSVDKYIQLCEDALDGLTSAELDSFDGLLTRVDIASKLGDYLAGQEDICSLRGKGGYFYEADIAYVADVIKVLDERVQTVVYYGDERLAHAIAKAVVDYRVRGVDRIVPVGQAMDIGIVWDGYDLACALSRIVDVR